MADLFEGYDLNGGWDETFGEPGLPKPTYAAILTALRPQQRGAPAADGHPGTGVHEPRGDVRVRRPGASVPGRHRAATPQGRASLGLAAPAGRSPDRASRPRGRSATGPRARDGLELPKLARTDN